MDYAINANLLISRHFGKTTLGPVRIQQRRSCQTVLRGESIQYKVDGSDKKCNVQNDSLDALPSALLTLPSALPTLPSALPTLPSVLPTLPSALPIGFGFRLSNTPIGSPNTPIGCTNTPIGSPNTHIDERTVADISAHN
ncbi:hypothetical protein J6590_034279 [Homalodisca vitripennis]|nr:hypothetical protein J6590_034279 [Homalodisca vitripennis]